MVPREMLHKINASYHILMHDRIYYLSFSDGNSWCILGDNSVSQLVDELAAIMELRESTSDDLPKIVFSCSSDRESGEEFQRPVPSVLQWLGVEQGWSSNNYGIINIWYNKIISDVVCEIKENQNPEDKYRQMSYSLLPVYYQSIKTGGLLCHAGLAELNGKGVLLAGPSGAGKSTCCSRLPDYWKPLCDDQALVVVDKQKEHRAHPLPTWSNFILGRTKKSYNAQHSVPIAALFLLEQSERDGVIPVRAGEASIFITDSSSWVFAEPNSEIGRYILRQYMSKFFNNACEMAKAIPVFRLRVSLYGRFWEEIEKVLGW